MKSNKQAWPTRAVMQQIYEMKLWGDNQSDFFSGIGSHDPLLINPYLEAVISFLNSFDETLVVCDLGCGDFNVGKELVKYSKHYIAADIVPELIEYNKKKFLDDNLEFHCLDIAEDKWPEGDCVILRQVLQHLSNEEIGKVVKKLGAFKYLILTEHIPEGEFVPNKDIIAGQGIRLKKGSGVDLLAAPFNLEFKGVNLLCSAELKEYQGVIVTKLYQIY